MKRKFSDLHCHNHMRPHFHMQQNVAKFKRKGLYSPWTVISSNRLGYLKGKMGASYSQSDLVKAWNGNVRLTFNSLYPLERQFVKGVDKVDTREMFKFLIGVATSHHLPLRDLIQTFYMRIPKEAVDFFQSKEYDYWDSLQKEMQFVIMDSGKTIPKNKVYTAGLLRRILEVKKRRVSKLEQELLAENARYYIPESKAYLEKSLSDDNEITMVLTIEGAHALGTDRASIAEISRRVTYLKSQWPVPVFFITFAHHFDNKLCGHAHSIPDKGKALLDQSKNLNVGFNENGKRIVRELLGLNKKLEIDTKLGYRILIDIKHMSAQSRKDYYREFIIPCIEKGDKIPVIASHCGFSGICSLDDHIRDYDLEVDDYLDPTGNFNAWNINVCEEDLEMIIKTHGLFGLSFDQRILGIVKEDKNSRRNGMKLLWSNIQAMAISAYSNPNIPDEDKPKFWKCITIGTDFEGLIDPIDPYPSVLEFEIFANNLVFELEQTRKDKSAKYLSHLKSREDSEQLVADFCYNNVEGFVKNNYPI